MKLKPIALLLPLVLVACGPAAPSPSPTPAAEGFYLRAWTTQALPPEFTFANLPRVVISDDLLIDGNVAVPAIFPGPLLILPNVRGITDAGQAAIIGQAIALGLLGEQTDFTGGEAMPGAQLGNIEVVVEGNQYVLLGDPGAIARCGRGCVPAPGTPEAFAVFWQLLSDVPSWLGTELGPQGAYTPTQLAMATVAPQQDDDPLGNRVAWPLAGTFADFGQPWAQAGSRCGVVDGADLDALLPALLGANQLTLFVDSTNEERGVLARAVLPGEPSPCGDEEV